MNKFKYAIEIGGAFTKIYVKNEGFALCEPTLVASEPSAQGYKIVGLGLEAKEMLGKTNDSIEVFSPLSNGKIMNYEYLKTLLEHFFEKLDFRKGHDSIIVLTSLSLSDQDKETFLSVFYEVGFKEVWLIPSILCACIGAGKNISSTKTNMMVSIGGANTDIAVINMNQVVKGATLGLGGKAVDVAIANTIAYNHGIVVGLGTSEKLKKEVGSLYQNDTLNMEVTGVDVDSKVPCSYIISSNDLLPVLAPFYEEIIRLIDVTLTSLQPEISQDIINNGVLFSGGMSNISGFEAYLKDKLKFPFKIIDNAEYVAILGAGKLLDDINLLKKIHENT
jgi:rod shape-determining protein MreB